MQGHENLPSIEPAAVVKELSAKLAPRSRHVSLLLGAGTSMTAGLPDLAHMKDSILALLSLDEQRLAAKLTEGRNIEQMLTRLRRISAIIGRDESVGGFTSLEATSLDAALCGAIVGVVAAPPGATDSFRALGVWAAGARYAFPIEIFTINYDTLIEAGLETEGVPYSTDS
jgi:hypothetical protein